MSTLKSMWNRIVAAFAVPVKGHGVSGSAELDMNGGINAKGDEHAAQSSDQWKSHGGFRK